MRHSKRQAMTQDAANTKRSKRGRSLALIRGLAAFAFVGILGFGGYQVFMHPDTPLPTHWNPTQPLRISDPVTPLTGWKLNRAAAMPEMCLAVLDGFAAAQSMADLESSARCHIRDRVDLSAVGATRLKAFETRCAVALRMAMWERHSLQPAAQDILGTTLQSIDHFGSYSCRTVRTAAGPSTGMSTHATAEAIDVSGFRFSDGTRISLLENWDDAGPAAAFLSAARDGACDWFRVTLSPEYNSLHADHFHLQSTGWGLCR
jgi:hypothetical protein